MQSKDNYSDHPKQYTPVPGTLIHISNFYQFLENSFRHVHVDIGPTEECPNCEFFKIHVDPLTKMVTVIPIKTTVSPK